MSRSPSFASRARLSMEPLEDRLAPATFTVTSTGDAGPGTLRQAIVSANALAGADRIEFAIGTGNQTIDLLSALPAITSPVTIAGQTQPGFAGSPLIELNGAGAGADADGIFVRAGGAGSIVRSLVINRFSDAGVQLLRTSCFVRGCFIGTDFAGTIAQGNGVGIDIAGSHFVTGAANTIGGTTTAARNVISGNLGDGVHIEGGDSIGHVIQGNLIGTDVTGTADLGNGGAGVRLLLGPSGNLIGGTDSGAGNVISGNGGDGVVIENAFLPHVPALIQNNKVQGNRIGTDANGTAALGNGGNGVTLQELARGNLVGGASAGARNVISGNLLNGVEIRGEDTTGNAVRGNYLGTDATGTLDLGNTVTGVHITDGASNNVVGGTAAGTRNVISGNNDSGVVIREPGTIGNMVLGNFIGTDKTGTLALANAASGVHVNTTHGNIIGGTLPGSRNVISGNALYGVALSAGSASNRVLGNFIGTDRFGMAVLGNGLGGVLVNTQGSDNVIGGSIPSARNVITGNLGHGVELVCDSARVRGNYIGTDVTGTIGLGNSGSGVSIAGGSQNNTIGGIAFGAGNVISGNNFSGVHISGATTSLNRVQGNRIGVAASSADPVGNGSDGVFIGGDAVNNRVGAKAAGAGNVIAFNVGAGVAIFSGTGNSVFGNRIFENAGRGIDLASDSVTPNDTDDADTGPNDLLNFPVLTIARLAPAGLLRIVGSINTEPGKVLRIEFFASPTADPTGFGEGKRFLGFVTVATTAFNSTAGFAVFLSSFGVQAGHFITATATDELGNTSEFSQALVVT